MRWGRREGRTRDKYDTVTLIAESKRNDTHELIHKTETDRQREQSYGYQGERVREREG